MVGAVEAMPSEVDYIVRRTCATGPFYDIGNLLRCTDQQCADFIVFMPVDMPRWVFLSGKHLSHYYKEPAYYYSHWRAFWIIFND